MSTERKIPSKVCGFCGLSEDNELKYGKFYEHDGIVTHYYCMLLSSNMQQKGNDDEGILGFLASDIQKEIRRGRKLICSYCKRNGATLGCCNVKCKKIFHFPCGLKDGSLNQFFGEFRTFCRNHRPKQQIDSYVEKTIEDSADTLCYICYDTVSPCDINTLWAPCCKKSAWFHRKCVQQLAMSAGYFFKCPLCNNKKEFQKAMLEFGIFIPNQDASWELVPNAFQELLYRHDQCDAMTCLCPKGRKYTSNNAKWELTLCRICGSQGIHMACGQLKWANPVWECEECTSILSKTKETRSSRMPVLTARARQHGQLSRESSSSDDSDTDISVGGYSPSPPCIVTPNDETSLQSSSFKTRPGPRSFKLQQRVRANKMAGSGECENEISSAALYDQMEKTRLSNRKDSYNENKNTDIIKCILNDNGGSEEINGNTFSTEHSKTINVIPIRDVTVIDSDNDVEIVTDKTTHLTAATTYTKMLPRIKRDRKKTNNLKSAAQPDLFRTRGLIEENPDKFQAFERNCTPLHDDLACGSPKATKRLKNLNTDSVMNIKITNVTSLSPEVFADVSHSQNYTIDTGAAYSISGQGNSAEFNLKRKSDVCKEYVLEQQTNADERSLSVEEDTTKVSVPVQIPNNPIAIRRHGLLLPQSADSTIENGNAIELSSNNKTTTLIKSKTFSDVSNLCNDLPVATNSVADAGSRSVDQSTIGNSTYDRDYDNKRRKVHPLSSPESVNYLRNKTFPDIPFFSDGGSNLNSTTSIFSQVTSNPNTCDRPRLIPEYVHLRDLKFRVTDSDYLQMILYDTFSVTLNVAKRVSGNLHLNRKSMQGFYKSKGLAQAKCTSEVLSKGESIKCNLKCSNKFLDYLAYAPPSTDIQCKEVSKESDVRDDDDDIKENLDPVSSPTACQSSLNALNAIERKTGLYECFHNEDDNGVSSRVSHETNTNYINYAIHNDNQKTEVFDANLTLNKFVADNQGGNSEQILHRIGKIEKTFAKSYVNDCDLNTNISNDAKVFQHASSGKKYLRDSVCYTGNIGHEEENCSSYSKVLQSSMKKLKNIRIPRSHIEYLDVNPIARNVLEKQNNVRCTHFYKGPVFSLTEVEHARNMTCKVSIDLSKIQKLLDSKPDMFCKYV